MCEKLTLDAFSKEDSYLIDEIENVKLIVTNIRAVRNQKNISPKVELELHTILKTDMLTTILLLKNG